MIAYQDEFKKERNQVIRECDPEKVREFARKHSVKSLLIEDDQVLIEIVKLMPVWE